MKTILQKALTSTLSRTQQDRLFRFMATQSPVEFHKMAHHVAHAPNMDLGLRKLAKRGLMPERIVDAGAFQGDWSRMAHAIWPAAAQIMIEANPDKKPLLETVSSALEAELHVALLGAEEGREETFYIMESGSSVFEENSPLDRNAQTIPTRQLDTLLAGRRVDFLKVDVQGFELEVLRGAREILQSVQAVLLEVSLIQVNKGAPLMAEVVGFMAERGFEVGDILEIHHRPLDRATNQADLLFVPRGSPLLEDTRHF